MKRYLLIAGILLNTGLMMAQRLTPSNEGSLIRFSIRNFGVATNGSFSGLEGDINFDESNPSAASFAVTVEAKTINTGIDLRDEHLRRSEYFDVQNYPKIRFVSTQVVKAGKEGNYTITGNLTIKNVVKEISFPFTATGKDGGYQFEGSFKINRREFGVGGGSFTLADNLVVNLSVFAKK